MALLGHLAGSLGLDLQTNLLHFLPEQGFLVAQGGTWILLVRKRNTSLEKPACPLAGPPGGSRGFEGRHTGSQLHFLCSHTPRRFLSIHIVKKPSLTLALGPRGSTVGKTEMSLLSRVQGAAGEERVRPWRCGGVRAFPVWSCLCVAALWLWGWGGQEGNPSVDFGSWAAERGVPQTWGGAVGMGSRCWQVGFGCRRRGRMGRVHICWEGR